MTDITEGPEPLTPEQFVTALLSTVDKKELADGVDA